MNYASRAGWIVGLFLAGCAFSAEVDTTSITPQRTMIVVASTDDPREEKMRLDAAQELQKHLALVFGTTNLPITVENGTPPGYHALKIGIAPEVDETPLADQETRWWTTPEATYLYGEGTRGTLYAVYGFLQDQVGIRWTAPGDAGIIFTPAKEISLQNGVRNWIPALRYRSIRLGDARKRDQVIPLSGDLARFKEFRQTLQEHNGFAEDVFRWQIRMRMYGSRPGGGHAFSDWWEKYGETHPEYFALNKFGKREPVPMPKPEQTASFVKVCPSNPRVADQLIADWLPRKDRMQFVNAGVNDGSRNFCECENCKALDAPLPGEKWDEHLTDRYVHLANAVAIKAREHRPDAYATMYAYLTTLQPPRRLRLEPNIVVQLVPYIDPLDLDMVNRHFEGWRKAGATQLMLRPNYHPKYMKTVLPLGIERQMFDVFQAAVSNGCIATDYDSLVNNWPVTGLSDYVLARSMAEPDRPFEYWAEEYYSGFGTASGVAREYFEFWREELWNGRLKPDIVRICNRGGAGDFARGLLWSLGDYYREEDFVRAARILDRAPVENLSPAEAKRLSELKLATEHAHLMFRAIVAQPQDKSEHAERLLAFRRRHKDDLPLRWLGVFARELDNGDLTGLMIAEEMRDYLKPWLPTDLAWKFQIDPQDKGLKEQWQKRPWNFVSDWVAFRTDRFIERQFEFDEPHNLPEELAEAIFDYDGISWYATRIRIPRNWRNRKILLRFGAVDESCWVYVNGRLAGEHLYKERNDWKTPFEIRIDTLADWDADLQDIRVRVQDTAGMGGIWRRVWLVSKAAENETLNAPATAK